MKTIRTTIRYNWAPGIWHTEDDQCVWLNEKSGLTCAIVRTQDGYLVGYVGATHGEDWYKAEPDELDSNETITNANFHSSLPGYELWWVGFSTLKHGEFNVYKKIGLEKYVSMETLIPRVSAFAESLTLKMSSL